MIYFLDLEQSCAESQARGLGYLAPKGTTLVEISIRLDNKFRKMEKMEWELLVMLSRGLSIQDVDKGMVWCKETCLGQPFVLRVVVADMVGSLAPHMADLGEVCRTEQVLQHLVQHLLARHECVQCLLRVPFCLQNFCHLCHVFHWAPVT